MIAKDRVSKVVKVQWLNFLGACLRKCLRMHTRNGKGAYTGAVPMWMPMRVPLCRMVMYLVKMIFQICQRKTLPQQNLHCFVSPWFCTSLFLAILCLSARSNVHVHVRQTPWAWPKPWIKKTFGRQPAYFFHDGCTYFINHQLHSSQWHWLAAETSE